MEKEKVKKEVQKFLEEHVTAAVSTVSASGLPQVATMYYSTDDDFNFYFICAKDSEKIKNLEINKNVALIVGFGPAPIAVQAGGVAEISYEFNEAFIDKVLQKTNFHDLDQWPVLQLEKDGLVLLKVKPTWLTFLNFDKEGHPETYRREFYNLIP